ncbi:hypothetical protein CYMTET_44751, partial [Cymbomonas tetramitiformis]
MVCLREKGRCHQLLDRRLPILWNQLKQLKELLEHWKQRSDSVRASSASGPPSSSWPLPGYIRRAEPAVVNDMAGLALDAG